MKTTDNNWQRRWHPLLQQWVLIAANTQQRPVSQGERQATQESQLSHDTACYLCPGNTRSSGKSNPDYSTVFVFDNDFPSLSPNAPDIQRQELFEQVEHLKGHCRVICYHPQHNIHLADTGTKHLSEVFRHLQYQFNELANNEGIEHVLLFENKGRETGASNPHPHGQIYATPFVPYYINRYAQAFEQHQHQHQSCLLCSLIEHEEKEKQRIIASNEYFVAFVPFFARFAYECMIVPRQHHAAINTFGKDELNSLAEIYAQLMHGYDRLFNMDFPNIISWINSPISSGQCQESFHCFISFCPPLRSATQMKYIAGFESAGGNMVNPVQPELAAEALREAIGN